MKDLVFKKGQLCMDVEVLRQLGKEKDMIYNIITKYDTSNGYNISVISVDDLDNALCLMRTEFETTSSSWIKDSRMNEEDISALKNSDEYILKDTYAYLNLSDEYLSTYITINKIVKSV